VDREELLEALCGEVRVCVKCRLSKTRTNAVPGEGSVRPRVMLVGEGPGREEDEQGRPFVGAAGKLLDELLASIGLSRAEAYIANVVKCRPPGNRPPTKEEIEACLPYLRRQMELLEPRVVCLLGNTAIKTLLDEDAWVARVHGRAYTRGGRTVIPMYHPAAAIYTATLKPVLLEDMKKLEKILEKGVKRHVGKMFPDSDMKNTRFST